MAADNQTNSADPSSQRRLGIWSATAVVAASMIGVSVYTTSGYSLASANSPWTVLIAWVIGAVIAICGAMSYAALASRFTESGGEYLFLSRTLHPAAGAMAGWVSVLAGFTAPIAAAALALESYFGPQLEWLIGWQLPERSIATLAIILMAFVHLISVSRSARIQDLVVALKLWLLVGVIVVAAMVPVSSWQGLAVVDDAPAFSVSSFATSLLYISFAFSGFNAAIYIAGEIRNPTKTVPRAMIWGTCLVAALYILLNAAFVLIPSRDTIAGQEQVATLAAEVIGGPMFAEFVRVIIVVSLLTSVSALMMTGPRVYAKMAEDGFLPRWFGFQGQRPGLAIVSQAAFAILVVHLSQLKDLLEYLGLTLSLSAAITVAMLFRINRKEANGSLLGYRIAPAIFVVAVLLTASIAALDPDHGAKRSIAAVATLMLGLVVYWWRPKPATSH